MAALNDREQEWVLKKTLENRKLRLAEATNNYRQSLWDLALFYNQQRRPTEARELVELLLALCANPEEKAALFLSMGQIAEQINEFEEAVQYYSQALSLEPTEKQTWYFINNNLGYALIQLGRHAEAESYLREAARIDNGRHNAFKNLGLCMEGQERFAEAVKFYVRSVRRNASDPRAYLHLAALYQRHPEIIVEVPDIAGLVDDCRKAVEFTRLLDEKDKKKG